MAADAGVSLKREKHFLPVTELTDKTFGLTQLKNTMETRTVKHYLCIDLLFYLLASTWNNMCMTVSADVWWCIVGQTSHVSIWATADCINAFAVVQSWPFFTPMRSCIEKRCSSCVRWAGSCSNSSSTLVRETCQKWKTYPHPTFLKKHHILIVLRLYLTAKNVHYEFSVFKKVRNKRACKSPSW